MNNIYAVKIKTKKVTPTYSNIGLYAVAGENSEFRWSETELSGVAEPWASGMLSAVGDISKSCNLINRGGVGSLSNVDVSFFNNEQMILRCAELEISLIGLQCEIYEYVGLDSDSDSEEIASVFSGFCGSIEAGKLVATMTIKSPYGKRRANMATEVSEENRTGAGDSAGTIIPVTFGSSDPDNDRYFKFVRTVNVNDKLNVEKIANFLGSYYPPKMSLFPLEAAASGNEPTLTYDIRIGLLDATAFPDADDIIGKYVVIVEGDAGNVGSYRKIVDATRAVQAGTGEIEVNIEVADYFNVAPSGYLTGTAENQTWVNIIDLDALYESDTFSCFGFVGDEEIFYDNNGAIDPVPEYGISTVVTDTDKNKLDIDVKQYLSEVGEISSLTIVPITDFLPYGKDDLSDWVTDAEAWGSDLEKETSGIYAVNNLKFVANFGTSENYENTYDRDSTTYAEYNAAITATWIDQYFAKVFGFTLPDIPETQKITNVFFGIKMWTSYVDAINDEIPTGFPGYRVMKRGYIDRVQSPFTGKILNEGTGGATMDNIPDEYWSTSPDTNNLTFYRQSDQDVTTDAYDDFTGWNFIDLDISSMEEYQLVEELIMILPRMTLALGSLIDYTKIYQTCVMIQSTATIEGEVYA